MTALLIGLGGVAGALLRFGLDSFFVTRRLAAPERRHWPTATLLVNAAGSLVIGVVFALTAHARLGPDASLVLATGFAGGLTTFSSWSVATAGLWEEGRRRAAALNVAANLAAGVAAAAAGIWCVDALLAAGIR